MELGYPFVDLDRVKPDLEARASIPLDLIQKHRVLPLKKEGNQIWVAMANVDDMQALDELKEATGCKINPCMCVPESLSEALEQLSK